MTLCKLLGLEKVRVFVTGVLKTVEYTVGNDSRNQRGAQNEKHQSQSAL